MDAPLSDDLGKMVIIAGIVLVVIGLLFTLGSRFGLGRLPGDIVYKGKHGTIYFPIVTCLVISVVVTLIFWLISFLSRK